MPSVPLRDWRIRIKDMLAALAAIYEYTRELDFESFCVDQKAVSAVLYNLIIIGEAARHIPEDLQCRYPLIPWSEIRGLRNIVAHDYARVNHQIVWGTIRNNLPSLTRQLEELLATEM